MCVCLFQLICNPRLQGSQTAIPTGSMLCRHCFKWGVFPNRSVAKIELFWRSTPFLSASVQLYACVNISRAILTHAVGHLANIRVTPRSQVGEQRAFGSLLCQIFRLYFSMAIQLQLPRMCTVEFVHISAHIPFAPRVCTLVLFILFSDLCSVLHSSESQLGPGSRR